jgi:hypothetical protein
MKNYNLFDQLGQTAGLSLFEGAKPKRCPKCRLIKTAAEFPTRKAQTYRPNAYCFPCQREYCRSHYQRNKKAHNARRYQHNKEYIARNKATMEEYLRHKACVDCGESDPVVLEFDHVRGTKKYEVSMLTRAGVSWRAVLDEIAKCEVRCANCHRRKTAIQFGWKVGIRVPDERQRHGR